jgi:hypothetical protein
MVVLVHDDVEVTSWPLVGVSPPGLAVADELARCQLAARRIGYEIRLRYATAELRELLDLVGLGNVVNDGGLREAVGNEAVGPKMIGPEVTRQAERGEQRGIDEVVVADDPVA